MICIIIFQKRIKETLDKALKCYQLSFDDISDKISICSEEKEDVNLDNLIGGLED